MSNKWSRVLYVYSGGCDGGGYHCDGGTGCWNRRPTGRHRLLREFTAPCPASAWPADRQSTATKDDQVDEPQSPCHRQRHHGDYPQPTSRIHRVRSTAADPLYRAPNVFRRITNSVTKLQPLSKSKIIEQCCAVCNLYIPSGHWCFSLTVDLESENETFNITFSITNHSKSLTVFSLLITYNTTLLSLLSNMLLLITNLYSNENPNLILATLLLSANILLRKWTVSWRETVLLVVVCTCI